MEGKQVELILTEFLKPRGFRKNAQTWYRKTAAGLQLLNLQRSSHGAQYYVNLAFVPEGMPSDSPPKEHRCPVRIRLTSAMPESARPQTELLFDLEQTAVADHDREAGIGKLLDDAVMPFLDDVARMGLKASIAQGMFKRGMVDGDAEQFLRL